ncbi:hypothetical protein FB451DRAFT_1555547 [Mycena latifolia]|nr:hypothetical protein FB451DRAFT_1555547 [Mycena latifolia]
MTPSEPPEVMHRHPIARQWSPRRCILSQTAHHRSRESSRHHCMSTKVAQAQPRRPRRRLDCVQPHHLVPLHLPPALPYTGTDQPPPNH